MLYKLIAAAAILGLSAAAPSSETAPANALTPPTAEEQERIDGIMLRSFISQLQQKVNKFETLALKEGMAFDTAPVALRNHNSDDPHERCMNKAKMGYFGCLDDNCLTTQCEQRTSKAAPDGAKEPYNGRKDWPSKYHPWPSPKDCLDCPGSTKENQALEELADTLMAQAEKYEEMLLSHTPQESAALTAEPSKKDMKKYFMNWGRMEAVCINTYNDAVRACGETPP